MKTGIKISSFEKLNNGLILSFSSAMAVYGFYCAFSNLGSKQAGYSIGTIFLILSCYLLFAIVRNSKSTFLYSSLPIEEKRELVKSISKEKCFKSTRDDNGVIKIQYQKYLLGLNFDIHFIASENYFEFNAFCRQVGIIDFGSRQKVMKRVENIIISKLKNTVASL